jgi:hypothetical protein
MKRDWMKSLLDLDISLENPIQVCSVSQKELQCLNANIYRDTRNAYITTGIISGICCDLDMFICDLLAFGHPNYAAGADTEFIQGTYVSLAGSVK